MSIPADWLHVGAQIATRLRTACPDLRQVRIAAALEEMQEAAPVHPAAWVIWDGDRILAQAGRGEALTVEQRWIVAVLARSARDADSGGGLIATAGPLLSQVLAALMGWQPDGASPLTRADAPRPAFAVGVGVFPLAFVTRLQPVNV